MMVLVTTDIEKSHIITRMPSHHLL